MDSYCGSFANYDANVLMNTDFVYAVEMIEHLYPETLENGMFNVFSQIAPKVAVFTTPNSDFNPLFNMTTQFRNFDHKFEWSQQQFIDWAYNLCARFPDYMVAFGGMGEPPSDVDIGPYGNCSQVAVFVRRDFWQRVTNEKASVTCEAMTEISGDADSALDIEILDTTTDANENLEQNRSGVPLPEASTQLPVGAYKLLFTTTLPPCVDTTTPEDNVLYTIRMRLNSSHVQDDYYNYDKHLVEVPLQDICNGFRDDPAITMEFLRRAINGSDDIALNADDLIVWNPYEDDEQLVEWQNEEDAKAYDEATEMNASASTGYDSLDWDQDNWD